MSDDKEFATDNQDTTAEDQGSQGHPLGGGKIGVGTGMSIGASRGNTGPGTGSDAMEAEYEDLDFSGATPGSTAYDDGGQPNTRGQLANESDTTLQGIGETGHGATVTGDTQGLGDDDTDAYDGDA